ncbi:NAD(P)-dependent alcohol dehydrogenase [Sphingomonas psychrolutea]|uniref:Aryl-alcohol dehydrogenase n=1 Tax=Sphingomonas psychrolutea TaxID=1259676 RepID=A0ABQ1GZT5_9SPHN|nr:NAD(P)-dependent alcohol dehydrogenase [Sphingomonas psychrolutea]GGA53248.1 aryl-alcohol dehydrogenase [Sphingomonas psychrolutea]
MREIEAAVVEAPGAAFRIEMLALGAPGPDQILVAIRACGICHTDLIMRDGHLPVTFPSVFGHEGAGIVAAVGTDVQSVQPGDHVLISFHSCGRCGACHDHQPGYCVEFVPRNFLGVSGPDDGRLWRGGAPIGGEIFGQSAFATHALAHARNVVKIDRDLPLEILAPLGCGVQTGAGTVLETLNVQPGESVAVLGAGAVGLSAVMAAVIAKAGRIAVLDRHQHRLALASVLGATVVTDDLATLGDGFDHIIDTTGAVDLVAASIDKLALRGTLALVGAYPGDPRLALDLSAIMSMGRKIIGVVEGGIDPQRFIPRLIDHYRAGALPLEKLIRTYPFAAIAEAVAASESGAVVKPVLIMDNRSS